MNSVVVDTSVVIDFLRCKDKKSHSFISLASENYLYVSVLTHTELWSGKSVWESTKVQKELQVLFSGLTILPVTEAISQLAGKLKSHHPSVALIDCLIAATAIQHNMPVATLNYKHFVVFNQLQLTPAPPRTA